MMPGNPGKDRAGGQKISLCYSEQFKTHELFTSGIFYLIFWDQD